MANQKITVEVDVQSNTAKETTQAERLGAALKDAAASAQRIKVPSAGAATGVGAVMARSQPVGAQALIEYGAERGTAGATGAAARDFARQSEALGGLVRLYATYAANIYAAGAAFRALSNAMDTANMVRGLDQLGAASGVALGALSKELVASTGGAISLREAMSATVKVTAAGLGSENVLRLGQVASKASQALGVDMNDAINRLSRGITKLEPELLDELGIFTKIEPAVQKYALSIGKSASQLTDFERRQAFANAVLEEGEKKFAAIKIDANPYNKLAASLQNIAQSGLDLVNKVLIPIVNFLSSSPTTLITILAGLGATLLSKVIPALREVGTGYRKSADEALQALQDTQAKAQAIRDQAAKVTQERINAAIDSAVAKADKAEQRIKSLQTASVAKTPEGTILTSQKAQIDPNDPSVKNAISGAYIRARELAAQGDKEGARALKDLADATKQYGKDLDALQQQQDKTKASNDKIIASNDRVARSLETKAWKDNVVEQTKFNASVGGLSTALTILRSEIEKNEQGLDRWGRATTLIRGSFGALIGTLDKVAGAISKVFFYVGIAITAFEALKSLASAFSGNSEKVKEFDNTITTANERLKNLTTTITEINKKPFADQLNTESVVAKATAINELANSSEKLSRAFDEQQRSATGFDKFFDDLKGKIPFLDNKTQEFSKTLGKNLFEGLKNVGDSNEAKQAKKSIEEVLNIKIDSSTQDDFIKAIEKIAGNSGKINSVNTAFKILTTNINNSALKSKELKTATEELDKAYKIFFDGLKSTDSFDILVEKQKKASIDLLTSLADPERALSDLVKTINDSSSAQLFDSETFNQLLNAKKGLEDLNEEQARNAALVASSRNEYLKTLAEAEKVKAKFKEVTPAGNLPSVDAGGNVRERPVNPEIAAANQRVKAAQEALSDAQKALDESKTNGVKATKEFALTAVSAFERGSNITAAKIEASLSKGATIVTDNLISVLGDLPGAAELRARNEQRQLDTQQRLITATYEQLKETKQNTLAVEKSNLLQLKRDIAGDPLLQSTEAGRQAIKTQLEAIDNQIKNISRFQDVIGKGPSAGQREINTQQGEVRAGLQAGTITPEAAAGQLKILDQAQQFFQRQAELVGRLNEIGQRRLSIEDTKELGVMRAREEQKQKDFGTNIETKQRDLAKLDTQERINGILNEQNRAAADKLRIDILDLQLQKERSQVAANIRNLEFAIGRIREQVQKTPEKKPGDRAKELADIAIAEQAIANEKQRLAQRESNDNKKIDEQKINNILDRQQKEKEVFDFNNRADLERVKSIEEQTKVRLDALDLELTRLNSIEGFNKLITINEKAKVDTLKVQSQQSEQLYELSVKSLELSNRSKELDELAASGQNVTEQRRRLDIETAALDRQRILLLSKNDLQLKGIEQTRQLAEQQELYNQKLTIAEQLSTAIKNVFEGVNNSVARVGIGFSNLVTILANVGVQAEKNLNAEIAARDTLVKARKAELEADPEQRQEAINARILAEKSLATATAKRTNDEINSYGQIAGAAKKMFKEKTAAYKILNVAEKGFYIARLAMENKWLKTVLTNVATELGAKITAGLEWIAAKVGFEGIETAAAQKGFLARSAILVKGIYLKVVEQLGVLGPPVAAAIIAAIGIAGLRKLETPDFKMSKEQQVETQGTGTTYDFEGRKVRAEGGVFGDNEAKADSIRKSLEIIKDNSTESLLYDNKALDALERLVLVLDKTAVSLYRIPDLIPTKEEAVTANNMGFGNIFGSRERTELKGSSIYFQGTLDQLASGLEGTVKRVDEVNRQFQFRFAFIKFYGSNTTMERTGTIDEETRALLAQGFEGVKDVVRAVGEQTGRQIDTRSMVLQTREPLTFRPGMTLEETQTQVTAFFSRELNLQLLREYGNDFKKYTQGQEEYAETIVRVITTNRSLNQSFQDLVLAGGKFANLNYDQTEELAQRLGGTQEAMAAFKAYSDSMYTDEQRLGARRARLAQTMNSLGLQDIQTKAQLNAKIEQLTRDGQQNTDTFIKLIRLAPQFAEVVDELESKVNDAYSDLKQTRDSLKDILKGLRDFRDSLNKTIMSPGELYLKAKSEFEKLAADAADNSSRTQQESARKIGQAGETFRAASSVMFASSDQYVADVKKITGVVDMLDEKFAGELSDAQKALDEAVKQNASLADIVENTENTYKQILALNQRIDASKNPTQDTGSANKTSEAPTKPALPSYTEITSGYKATPSTGPATFRIGETGQIFTLDPKFGSNFGNRVLDTIFANTTFDYDASNPITTGATGSNYIPKDMPLYVHEGERLMPAADNRKLMQMVSEYSGSSNTELYQEVCRLTKQVETLTQVVADGAIMNANATDRNTEQIANTIQNSAETAVYSQKLQNRTAIV